VTLEELALQISGPERSGHVERAREVLKRMEYVEHPVGVEVGVYVADMSIELLKNPALTLFMVDPWGATAEDSPYYKSGDHHAQITDGAQQVYEQYSRARVDGKRAVVLKARSTDAALLFSRELDFVFLDGDHSYEAVVADIEAWRSKIRIGGWLCGHDYANKTFPEFGVQRAVDEFITATESSLEFGENMTWFVRINKRNGGGQ